MSAAIDVRVMTQNCAAFKLLWAVRVAILVARVKVNRPDILTCVELYAARRPKMTKLLKGLGYDCVGTHMGKVIYRRRGRGIVAHEGSLLRMHLGNGKHALACRFEHRSGTTFVVTVSHLSWQIRYDKRRHSQTHRLISMTRKRYGTTVPTIHTGDYNSSIRKGKRKRDAVGAVFKSRGFLEAFTAARLHECERYNSSNRFLRPPPRNGVHLDRVFGDRVQFVTWLLDYYPPRARRPFYGADHFGLVVDVLIPSK